MPIEIRELVVKATVAPVSVKDEVHEYPARGENENRDTIVNECVERVLQIIKEKEER